MVRPCVYKKSTKIIQAQWHVPVAPDTQEAVVGGSLEPESQRLQLTKIMPLHSSLGDTVRTFPHRKHLQIIVNKILPTRLQRALRFQ